MAAELILAIVFVAANGFFVATEFAVARLRPSQAREMLREGRPGSKSAMHAVEHIDAYLSACQLGITVSSLGLGAIGEPAFHDLLEPVFGDETTIVSFGLASLVAFMIITTLHVVLGELAPKSLAISRTAPVVLVLAPLMRAFYMLTKPLVDLFNTMGNLVLKPFGVPPAAEAGHQPHSEDELRELLRESSRLGMIELGEQRLSDAALVFGDLRAREVMKPRGEIDYVLVTDPPSAVARRAIETGRTRLPVCEAEGDLESTRGAVNAKDLLTLLVEDERAIDLEARTRPIGHVAESARVDEVLRGMREERVHLALVRDEHGTVIGLLTMEDILEELVGEIEDEFDAERADLVREEGGRLVLAGQAPVRVLSERLGMEVEEHRETTVGGYLSSLLARTPEVGEVLELGGLQFEILGVDETLITEVAVAGDAPAVTASA